MIINNHWCIYQNYTILNLPVIKLRSMMLVHSSVIDWQFCKFLPKILRSLLSSSVWLQLASLKSTSLKQYCLNFNFVFQRKLHINIVWTEVNLHLSALWKIKEPVYSLFDSHLLDSRVCPKNYLNAKSFMLTICRKSCLILSFNLNYSNF